MCETRSGGPFLTSAFRLRRLNFDGRRCSLRLGDSFCGRGRSLRLGDCFRAVLCWRIVSASSPPTAASSPSSASAAASSTTAATTALRLRLRLHLVGARIGFFVDQRHPIEVLGREWEGFARRTCAHDSSRRSCRGGVLQRWCVSLLGGSSGGQLYVVNADGAARCCGMGDLQREVCKVCYRLREGRKQAASAWCCSSPRLGSVRAAAVPECRG